MKRWLLLLAVAGVVVVGLLARRNQAPGTRIVSKTESPPPPSAPPAIPVSTVSNIDVRAEVARLLERLIETLKTGDFMAKGAIQDELRALGLPAVAPMREDLLGNDEGWHRALKFHEAIRDTLLGMASPDVGTELLKSWVELDGGKHLFHPNTAGLKLGYFADVIVKQPPADSRDRINRAYAEATRVTIKKSLIELMGRLLSRFPEFRDDLLRIMKEDASSELRNAAAIALGASDPRAVLPDMVKKLKTVLGDAKSSEESDLAGVMEVILKALPIDEAIELLKKEIGEDLATHQLTKLNKLGMTLGWICGEPDDVRMEVILVKASGEKSPPMQVLYLGALGMAPLRKNTDPRLTDLAVSYLDASTNEGVRSHALAMITAMNRDEATLFGAYDKGWKEGGYLAFCAAGQLKFYVSRYAKSDSASEKLKSYLTQGSVETRLKVMEGLRWGNASIPPSSIDQLKTMAQSDPDPGIREGAARTLKWAGVPLE